MTHPETDSYLEPAEPVTAEEKIKRSLFIGNLFPCRSSEEVRLTLARVETEHRNATHNCWAYFLGPEPEIEYSSDDGEPAGTAGKPILSTIRQSGMINLMIVVTRYFGGVKLGVRGLTEAYGQVAGAVVLQAVRVERIRSRRLVISLPYAIIGDVTHLLNANGMVGIPRWIYEEKVEVVADVRLSAVAGITDELNELRARNRIHSWSWVLHN